MDAHELMKIGGGLIIAVFLAGCLILVFCVLGITGSECPLTVSGNVGPSHAPLAYDTAITLEVPLPASPKNSSLL